MDNRDFLELSYVNLEENTNVSYWLLQEPEDLLK